MSSAALATIVADIANAFLEVASAKNAAFVITAWLFAHIAVVAVVVVFSVRLVAAGVECARASGSRLHRSIRGAVQPRRSDRSPNNRRLHNRAAQAVARVLELTPAPQMEMSTSATFRRYSDPRFSYTIFGPAIHAVLLIVAQRVLQVPDGLRLCLVMWVCVKAHSLLATYCHYSIGGAVVLMMVCTSLAEALALGYVWRITMQ